MPLKVGRVPLLTLWAAVVARRCGYLDGEALTWGRAVAGQTAAAKAKRLGLSREATASRRPVHARRREIEPILVTSFMEHRLPCVRTPEGLRTLSSASAIDPSKVRTYPRAKLGDALAEIEGHREAVAATYAPEDLERQAMNLHRVMRPSVPHGEEGWGKADPLDLETVDRLRAPRGAAGAAERERA
ncbi:MAG: hypothetical protein AB1778_00735 [Candidatus Bipolaricaulota bacterium]